MPKISVIMGVYNGEKKIKKAIDSILNQEFSDFEFIICDDGSTDNTVNIIEEYAEKDNRIVLIKNSNNLGLAKTLNNCLEISKGDYIARMDDDDISHSTRFKKQVLFLDNNKEYALVGTSRNLYDSNGIWGKGIEEGERSNIDVFMGKSFVHPSIMMRRSVLENVNGYTVGATTERTEDFDLWCKLYSNGYRGYNLKDILLDYYEARDSYNKRKYKYRIREFKLKLKWFRKLNIPNKYMFFAFRPLIVGMIPVKILMRYHQSRFKN